MERVFKIILIGSIVFIVLFTVFYFGYNIITIKNVENNLSNTQISEAPSEENNTNELDEEMATDVKNIGNSIVKPLETETSSLESITTGDLIRTTEDTKIKVIYTDDDGNITKEENLASGLFPDKTKEELGEIFQSYEIEKFSEDEVIIRKTVEEFEEGYVLGINGNYITVFHRNNMGDLETIEETSINSNTLAGNDLELLNEGMYFQTKDELYATLENFDN